MPKIPEYQRQVREGGPLVPNIGQGVQPGPSATAQLGEALTKAADSVVGKQLQIEAEQLERSNNTWLKEQEANLIQRRLDDTYNPEYGLLSKKYQGKNSLQASSDLEKRRKEYYAELEAGVSNEWQRENLRALLASDTLKRSDAISKRVSREMGAYEKQTDELLLRSKMDEVFDNPMDAPNSIRDIEMLADDLADKDGLTGDAKKIFKKSLVSNAHVAAITAMIQNEDPESADAYYQKHMKSMTPNDQIKTKRLVEDQSSLSRAQANADRIMDMGLGYSESLEEARKIPNAEERRDAVAALKVRLSERKQAFQHEKDQAWIDYQTFRRDNPNKRVPATILARLTDSQKIALNKNPAKVKTDARAWVEFKSLPTARLKELSIPELELKYLSKMDTAARRNALERYSNAQKDSPEVAYENLTDDLIMEAAVRVGLAKDYNELKKKKPQLLLEITNRVHTEIAMQKNAFNKENLSRDDLDTIVRGFVDNLVYDHGGIFGIAEIRHALEVDPEDDEDIVIKRENVSEIDKLSWKEFAKAMNIDSRDLDEEERFYYLLYKAREQEKAQRR